MRTQTNILRTINKKINTIKKLFIIILIFQSCIFYQVISHSQPIQEQENKQPEQIELNAPPELIPELQNIDFETIVKHESI